MTYDRKEALADLAYCHQELIRAEDSYKNRIQSMKRSITRAHDSGEVTWQELFDKIVWVREMLGVKDMLDLQLLVEEIHDEHNEDTARQERMKDHGSHSEGT